MGLELKKSCFNYVNFLKLDFSNFVRTTIVFCIGLESSLSWFPLYAYVLPILMSFLHWCPPNTDVVLKLIFSRFLWPFCTGVLSIQMSSLYWISSLYWCPSWHKFGTFPELLLFQTLRALFFYWCLILPVTKQTNLHFASHQDPQPVKTLNFLFSNPLCLAVQQSPSQPVHKSL